MLASNGLATPPCGVPRALLLPPLMRRFPSPSCSSIGALSHSLISRSTWPSTMRRATDLMSSLCGIESKYLDRYEVRLEDRFQHNLGRSLHHAIPDGWNAERTLASIRLRDHRPPHRVGPIPLQDQFLAQAR